MSFFITDAFAASASAPSESGMNFIFLLVMFMAIFYFLLFRPQSKRAKEHQTLIANLAKGDEVIVAGGLYGKIAKMTDTVVVLIIAENVEVKVQKSAIISTVPKGTLKQL